MGCGDWSEWCKFLSEEMEMGENGRVGAVDDNGGDAHNLMLACVTSGTLFAVMCSASFSILWAVNWRPWRIYR